MKLTNVVEIYRGRDDPSHGGFFGSGYALDSEHVLTALHVFCTESEPATQAANIVVRQFHPDKNVFSRRKWIPARCIWADRPLDMALLHLAPKKLDEKDMIGPVFGEIATEDPVDCLALGFPKAMARRNIRDTYELKGHVTPNTGRKSGLIHIDAPEAPFQDPEEWKGLSGAALFSSGDPRRLLGVITKAPEVFNSKALKAAPIVEVEDSFPLKLKIEDVGVPPATIDPLELLEHLYLANYSIQKNGLRVGLARRQPRPSKLPLILSVTGVPEDELEALVKRFENDLLPKALPLRHRAQDLDRGDAGERMVRIDLLPSRAGLLASLEDLRDLFLLEIDVFGQSTKAATFEGRVAELVNRRDGPRAFYTYVKASNFTKSHRQLCEAWLSELASLADQPLVEQIVYLFCFERDGPVPHGFMGRIPFLGGASDIFQDFSVHAFQNLPELHRDLGRVKELTWLEDIEPWLNGEDLESRLAWSPAQRRKVLKTARDVLQQRSARMTEVRRLIEGCAF